MRHLRMLGYCLLSATAAPALAQTSAVTADRRVAPSQLEDQATLPQQPLSPMTSSPTRNQAGRTTTSAVGEVGQRQSLRDAPAFDPMARIDSRIQNRVQSRLRNRIDRYYDPQANVTSPFVVAGEQARKAGQSPRR